MSCVTLNPFVSFSVGCVRFNGRMVGREFADLAGAERFYAGAVSSGNYTSVVLYGYSDDGDCVEMDGCTDCYRK